jgi:hypothetical protein
MAVGVVLLAANLLAGHPAKATEPTDLNPTDWVVLDNGHLRVGLKRASGGAIGWISASGSTRNLVNSYDRGRLIQQSYYGRADGALWNGQPWRWNPVQGGDWQGRSTRLLDLQVEGNKAYVKTLPKHWASGEDLTEALMQQWLALEGDCIRVRYRFEVSGGRDHPVQHQELPAVFVQPEFQTLVVYRGDQPWTDQPLDRLRPGWPNEIHAMTEHWAAYVDQHDYGLGIYVPVANRLTCYRYGSDPKGIDACAYLAPLGEFAIKENFQWQYEVVLSIGTSQQLRSRFYELAHPSVQAAAGSERDPKPTAEKATP